MRHKRADTLNTDIRGTSPARTHAHRNAHTHTHKCTRTHTHTHSRAHTHAHTQSKGQASVKCLLTSLFGEVLRLLQAMLGNTALMSVINETH